MKLNYNLIFMIMGLLISLIVRYFCRSCVGFDALIETDTVGIN